MAATAGTLGLAGASNLQGESQVGDADQQPNVLMIQADQLTADVLGCYGGPVPTPNIGRLADEPMRLAQRRFALQPGRRS